MVLHTILAIMNWPIKKTSLKYLKGTSEIILLYPFNNSTARRNKKMLWNFLCGMWHYQEIELG